MSSSPSTPADNYFESTVKIASHLSVSVSPTVLEDVPAVGVQSLDAALKHTVREESSILPVIPLDSVLEASVKPHTTQHHYSRSLFSDLTHNTRPQWEWVDGERVLKQSEPKATQFSQTTSSGDPSTPPVIPSPQSESLGGLVEKAPSLCVSRTSSSGYSETPSLSPSITELSDFTSEEVTDDIAESLITRPSLKSDVHVRCMVRTRVPTPHGEVFLHLYHNDKDNKEHLAIVVDPAQLEEEYRTVPYVPFIRSKSLDAVWDDEETPMDRVTRGAYIGRLSEKGYTASTGSDTDGTISNPSVPDPLVRIHSECFTGETIGSMRCDCGEQLDEALRRIAEPITLVDSSTGEEKIIPGRGAVIYMRQEGRGIGLLSKLRAYNLQDLGHDTVQANLLLGHGADERGYEVAAAILHDLGLGVGGGVERGLRLLTNNPDKVKKLTDAGVHVSEQVSMVPRTWKCQSENVAINEVSITSEEVSARLRSAGATLLGASTTHGPELEKYLRTKVLRMGHMLSLPPSGTSSSHEC